MGFEPMTYSLRKSYSTPELHRLKCDFTRNSLRGKLEMKMKFSQKGFNYIGLTLIVFSLLIGIMIFPLKLPKSETNNVTTIVGNCAPEDYRNTNAPTLQAPGYSYGGADELDINLGSDTSYRRLKRGVIIPKNSFIIATTGQPHHWLGGPTVTATDNKKYTVYYPNNVAEVTDKNGGEVRGKGYNYSFEAPNGQAVNLKLSDHGIIAAVYIDDAGMSIEADGYNNEPNDRQKFWIADIYWDPGKQELPQEVLECKNFSSGVVNGMVLDKPIPGITGAPTVSNDGSVANGSEVMMPEQQISEGKDQLQLEWFKFGVSAGFKNAWWTPHCKPAVYLYPEKPKNINVKVFPKGHFTYTDPPYDMENGWNVKASSDGQLLSMNDERITSGYLYYEAAIRDDEIEKPQKGFVVKYEALPEFLSKILPKAGLNPKESEDFKEYWEKTLPKQNYYFIGFVSRDNLDYIEPIEVSPKPDSIHRISLYFEALDEFKVVLPPDVSGFERNGFSVVEWGGLVKLHKDTPFTCSQ